MRPTDVAAEPVSGTAGNPEPTPLERIESLLLQAAEAAVACGLCPHEFLAGCQAAYAMANPAIREHLESHRLLAQLDDLRRRGRLAQA